MPFVADAYKRKEERFMGPCEFEGRCQEQQIEIINRHAVYLAKRRRGGQAVLLFQMEGFYIEISYWTYRRHIKSIKTFCSTDRLEPYLNLIRLDEVLHILD